MKFFLKDIGYIENPTQKHCLQLASAEPRNSGSSRAQQGHQRCPGKVL